jgi:hypothetical protein
VPIACAKERGLCEQWAECAISTPVEECVVEREQECAERALVALQSGACFLPQIAATNAENGCHENWQSTLGACLLSTLEELTLAFEPCLDEWTSGNIPEGGACMYGVAGCARADVPEREARCDYTSSFEPGGGLCRWHLDLPRGAACDPEQGAYCNGSDGCLSSGICDQRRELGEACEVDNDCASLLCAEGVCTDPHGFSCAERTCPSLWSCVDERCARVARL